MKSPCKPVWTAIATALLIMIFSLQGYAAFPVKAAPPKTAVAPPAVEGTAQEGQPGKQNTIIEKPQRNIKNENHGQGQAPPVTDVLSFIMGIAGAASLVAAIIFGSAGLAIALPIAFGIAAIILGAIGAHKRHRHKGFGIAGLILGIIDVSIGVTILGLLILISHVLNSAMSGVF